MPDNHSNQTERGDAESSYAALSGQLAELHQKLLREGPGPEIKAALHLLLYKKLTGWLQGRYPRDDPQAISDAVSRTLERFIKYAPAPESHPDQSLLAFLKTAAERHLQHWFRSNKRRQEREARILLEGDLKKYLQHDPAQAENTRTPRKCLIEKEDRALCGQFLDRIKKRFPDPRHWDAFCLWLEGERRTRQFAKALGITHLPPEQQRRQVKAFKDHIYLILKELRRHLLPSPSGNEFTPDMP